MSGGHFDYDQARIREIAYELDSILESPNNYDYGFSKETLNRFKHASKVLHQAYNMAQCIDWLVSGDDSEETFKERWNKECI